MSGHPTEFELALLAGGDCGVFQRYWLNRHIRQCDECSAEIAGFEMLRGECAEAAPPELDWNRLSLEMRANIHVGLEAGECIRRAPAARRWNPRLTMAFASLMVLVGAGLMMRSSTPEVIRAAAPTIESNDSGIELRSGSNSMTILNRRGAAAGQTVSAQGEIGARYIDGETGAVTINNVYPE